jgi:hypothetical protein
VSIKVARARAWGRGDHRYGQGLKGKDLMGKGKGSVIRCSEEEAKFARTLILCEIVILNVNLGVHSVLYICDVLLSPALLEADGIEDLERQEAAMA